MSPRPTYVDKHHRGRPDMAHIGAVLSSGGGRGVYAHTGFLLALNELGIDLDVMAGCSAGALVGGIAASGTDLHHWSDAISKLATREYWSPDPWYRMAWQMTVRKGRGYTGLSDTAAAIDFVRRNLTVQTFAECPIPLYVLATNLTRGTKTLFSSGELAPRIMASAAMPVLYRPVEIDGELYCDGAVIEFAPTEAICCRHQLDVLLIHHTAAQRDGDAGGARLPLWLRCGDRGVGAPVAGIELALEPRWAACAAGGACACAAAACASCRSHPCRPAAIGGTLGARRGILIETMMNGAGSARQRWKSGNRRRQRRRRQLNVCSRPMAQGQCESSPWYRQTVALLLP